MTPLRQRMTEAMQIRNFTHNTQSAYLQQIAALAKYYHQSPEALGAGAANPRLGAQREAGSQRETQPSLTLA